MINLVVFVSGMTTLGVELAAIRLLSPAFGASHLVWATLIGLFLAFLTLGYLVGGRLADRWPSQAAFFRLAAWGAFTAGLIPFAARPLLAGLTAALAPVPVGLVVGSGLAVMILLSVPVTLLGCVSPFAIRLGLKETRQAGKTSGQVYALSTLGSILGTFLPVLLLIPLLGTARTFLAFSLFLVAVALAGLIRIEPRAGMRHLWMPITLLALSLLALPPAPSSAG